MIAIHQSQFMPWLPYFYKILKSDNFVVLDDVQFQKNGVQNRNMIKTPQGAKWLTVPVSLKFGTPINKVEVADTGTYAKHANTLEACYKKSRFFKDMFSEIREILQLKLQNLHALNMNFLKMLLAKLGRDDTLCLSSSLGLRAQKDDLLIGIIEKFKENEYLSGKGALDYMDLKKYKAAGIKVYTFDFQYRQYNQLWNKRGGFIPDLSVVDLLFNDLENAAQYILNNGTIERVI